MEAVYHRQVLERVLCHRVSPRAVAAITLANLDQDSLRGLLRPEIHFDNSLIAQGLAYMQTMRAVAATAQTASIAWEAFGRLSHAAQDFYSHSNYVALWLEQFAPGSRPAAGLIDGLNARLLRDPRLFTGRIYLPLEALCLFPPLRRFVKSLLPRDAHAWLNLDAPETGPLFPYSVEAAAQDTTAEFEYTLSAVSQAGDHAAVARFMDH